MSSLALQCDRAGVRCPPSTAMTSEAQRHEFHRRSPPIPTRPIRTVLIDVSTDSQRAFWDAPLWLPIGGIVEGGEDLWEVVSVRLRMPTASPDDAVRPVPPLSTHAKPRRSAGRPPNWCGRNERRLAFAPRLAPALRSWRLRRPAAEAPSPRLSAAALRPSANTGPAPVPSNRRVRARAPPPRPGPHRARHGSRAGRTSPARRHTPSSTRAASLPRAGARRLRPA